MIKLTATPGAPPIRATPVPDNDFDLTAAADPLLVEDDSIGDVEVLDRIETEHTDAVVDNNAIVSLADTSGGAFDRGMVFTNHTPEVAAFDEITGAWTRVADGTAKISARSLASGLKKSLSRNMTRTTGAVSLFNGRFVEGTMAHAAASAMDALMAHEQAGSIQNRFSTRAPLTQDYVLNPQFIAHAYDWTGSSGGRNQDDNTTATMISPDCWFTVKHYAAVGYVTFINAAGEQLVLQSIATATDGDCMVVRAHRTLPEGYSFYKVVDATARANYLSSPSHVPMVHMNQDRRFSCFGWFPWEDEEDSQTFAKRREFSLGVRPGDSGSASFYLLNGEPVYSAAYSVALLNQLMAETGSAYEVEEADLSAYPTLAELDAIQNP